MDVTIDGVPYAPVNNSPGARIGIGITTRNRNDILATALKHHADHQPPGVVTVVVDDASDTPVAGAEFRFQHRAGIASAKNKCLELLAAAGVDHLFLFDDDAWPVADHWWTPYVQSPEPHLMYIFEDLRKPPYLKDIHQIGSDDQHTAWSGPRGCMLYVHRDVLPVVGGMDTAFNPWGYEHGDWSNRIHHAGLTTWRYADVRESAALFHSMDEWAESKRTVGSREREALVRDRVKLHHDRRDNWHTGYADFRQPTDDVTLTTLLTGGRAPKSGRGYRPTTELIKDLAGSVHHGRLVVLHDQLRNPKLTTGHGQPVEFVQVGSPDMNVFFYRHRVCWQWLRGHPNVARAWCVDGTDVVQLRDPFAMIEPGHIHVGWEPKTLADQWMVTRHQEPRVAGFLADHPNHQLLNAGLIGGDRATVLEFLHGLFTYWQDVEMVRGEHDQGDMGQLQRLAYGRFGDRLVTGTAVATVFKAHQPNDVSPWQHK